MLAVAMVAVLINVSLNGIARLGVFALVVWGPILIVTWGLSLILKERAWNGTAIVLLCMLGVGGLWSQRHSRTVGELAFGTAVVALTVANLAGPLYVIRRLSRREPIAAGHLLWAWSGLIWPFSFGHTHSGTHGIDMAVESCQLTLVITVLLALYGSKPTDKRAAWGHYAGWILVECQVILWGLLAAQYLR
jgi:hypothetical protein